MGGWGGEGRGWECAFLESSQLLLLLLLSWALPWEATLWTIHCDVSLPYHLYFFHNFIVLGHTLKCHAGWLLFSKAVGYLVNNEINYFFFPLLQYSSLHFYISIFIFKFYTNLINKVKLLENQRIKRFSFSPKHTENMVFLPQFQMCVIQQY